MLLSFSVSIFLEMKVFKNQCFKIARFQDFKVLRFIPDTQAKYNVKYVFYVNFLRAKLV
jgi:hypothetical protein